MALLSPSPVPLHRRITAVGRDLVEASRFAFHDTATAVDRDPAAFIEHVADLLTPALDARLHAGQGDPEHL
jgi:hypothetical protein